MGAQPGGCRHGTGEAAGVAGALPDFLPQRGKGLATGEVARMLQVNIGQVYLIRHRLAKEVKQRGRTTSGKNQYEPMLIRTVSHEAQSLGTGLQVESWQVATFRLSCPRSKALALGQSRSFHAPACSEIGTPPRFAKYFPAPASAPGESRNAFCTGSNAARNSPLTCPLHASPPRSRHSSASLPGSHRLSRTSPTTNPCGASAAELRRRLASPQRRWAPGGR